MKPLRSILCAAAILLAGCEERASMPPAPRPEPAPAPAEASSTEPAYYPSGYGQMKEAAAQFARDNFGGFGQAFRATPGLEGRPFPYHLEDCGEPFENVELAAYPDAREQERESLARRVAKHEFQLGQVYDRALFEEPLRDYERQMLAWIEDSPATRPETSGFDVEENRPEQLLRGLARALEERRLRVEPTAAPIAYGGDCGAGEQPYIVQSDPDGGRIWLTTKFSFDLCGVRRRDQWDVNQCRWTELGPDQEAYLSGRYVYQASWPGGERGRGVRTFDGQVAREGPEVVRIRPG